MISGRWFWVIVIALIALWDGPSLAWPEKIETASHRHKIWARNPKTAVPLGIFESLLLGHLWGLFGKYDPLDKLANSIRSA